MRELGRTLAILRDYCKDRGLTYEMWKGEVIVDRVDADNRGVPLKYYADERHVKTKVHSLASKYAP